MSGRLYPAIRRSQLVTTYGPGAMVDLPEQSIIIGGVDDWQKGPEIEDSRLRKAIEDRFARARAARSVVLASPQHHDRKENNASISAYRFPEWMLTRRTFRWKNGATARAMVYIGDTACVTVPDYGPATATGLDLPDFVDAGPRKGGRGPERYDLVAIRFVAACPSGHLQDVPWRRLVHADRPGACAGQLFLVERGTAGELRGTTVECACGATLSVSDLVGLPDAQKTRIGSCDGHMPWLGADGIRWYTEGCSGNRGAPHPLRLLVRHASNAWLSVTMRALSLPERPGLDREFDMLWSNLLCNMDESTYESIYGTPLAAGFRNSGGTIRDLLAMARRRREADQAKRGVRLGDEELDLLLSVEGHFGEDNARSVFTAERISAVGGGSSANLKKIGRVVLVHRLREVQALVGFTRLDQASVMPDDDVDLPVSIAPIARDLKWVPAAENRGEGVFVMLDPDAVGRWMARPEVLEHARAFHPALASALKRPDLSIDEVLGDLMGRILVHTLSHALLQQMALDAGYASASIRERIYARPDRKQFGVLLYTSSPDAEGTMGGLVALGRRLGPLLDAALEQARLCSHDPVCAHHAPDPEHELATGAACHGCLFVAESSCAMRNQLLDRALLVPTVANTELAFFE